jgi:diguanylate cyclase (GGDEF)-like protein
MRRIPVDVRVLSLALLQGVAAVAMLSLATPLLAAGSAPVMVPGWTLGLGYLAAGLFPVVYEVRGEARTFSLTQFALAIGLVFVAPWTHLAARIGSLALEVLVVRRQPPLKALLNLSVAALEVATAITVSNLVVQHVLSGHPSAPGPELWLALAAGVVLAELVAFASMQTLFTAVGAAPTLAALRAGLAVTAGSTTLFTGAAIVIVAAAWSDVWTALVGCGIGCVLALGYRKHRRLTGEQQQTTALHQFIKGLGPLDLAGPGSHDVLTHVRALLQARHLELAVQVSGGWQHFRNHEDNIPQSDLPAVPVTSAVPRLAGDDQMSAPLVGGDGAFGVLTVSSRIGGARPFGLRDLRLLETLAAELSTAVERGRLQRELAQAATTDALTGLPNLHETTAQLDGLGETHPDGILVAALAVDSFREVNDSLGHQVGDDLLREVTRRLRLAYPDALLGRIGGGRFAVAMPSAVLGDDPAMFGLGLRAQVEGGAQLGPVGTHIRLSVGCVRGPEHGREAATLIRRAETAMYSARHATGGPVVWEPAYEVEGQRRLAVVMALREALTSGAIGVGYQPKIDTQTRRVSGVEALARWTHPALGAISPSEFVPLAEAAGLMGPLTATVLRQGLTACKGWQRHHERTGERIGVAVNVSAETILDASFVTEVATLLTSVGVPPDLLTLELTEGVALEDPGLASQRMSELRALGVKLSVDDFGTGYSSLTYLKGLPVDEVKIAKGFVDGLVRDGADRAVVRAVVDIAHTLGLRVVAEGVEQEEQDSLLTELGVDEVQGFLHARPMPAVEMMQWLRRRDREGALEG